MVASDAFEVNFDGIVGPSHNFAGLSYGNVASVANQNKPSNPRRAALQGLEKMYQLYKLGIPQAVLPPHERPVISVLRSLGFAGSNAEIIQAAHKNAPEILLACSSAAAMWTANAATVTPSADSSDRRLHFTPANLNSKFHRSIEAPFTYKVLKAIFSDENSFAIHSPLPESRYFADEGAANHTRFCATYGTPGLHLFVYGRSGFQPNPVGPLRFPARQTIEAFEAIARSHGLQDNQMIFAQQNPKAIDLGVFHNDVIALGNLKTFFYHEHAYLNTAGIIEQIDHTMREDFSTSMEFIRVSDQEISLAEAVRSYLFNSLLVQLPNGSSLLVCPNECQEISAVKTYLDTLIASRKTSIKQVIYFDLRESMRNGGGPACLRLRVVMTPTEIDKARTAVFMSDDLYHQLKKWIETHYRESLSFKDLADPLLYDETCTALNELSSLLQLGTIYSFQR